jgi:hypothetical protein
MLGANLSQDMGDSALSGLSVSQLRARRRRLARSSGDPETTLRGTLHSQGRRCGRPGCRCARGELHGPYLYLAVYSKGRSRSLYVPGGQAQAVGELVGATARREAALREIARINVELLRRRALG